MNQFKGCKIGDLVIVDWEDAYEHIGKNYKLKDTLTSTVGWLIKQDKKRIYLSMFYCGIVKKFASPYVSIPKGMIEKVRILL